MESSQLILHSPNISRRHAMIDEQDGNLIYIDQSLQGSTVDGVRLQNARASISRNSVVHLDNYKLTFRQRPDYELITLCEGHRGGVQPLVDGIEILIGAAVAGEGIIIPGELHDLPAIASKLQIWGRITQSAGQFVVMLSAAIAAHAMLNNEPVLNCSGSSKIWIHYRSKNASLH